MDDGKRAEERHVRTSSPSRDFADDGTPHAANPLAARILLFFCRYAVPLFSKLFRTLLHCDIYCDLRGRTVTMPHPYGIVVHSKARIGNRVVIMQQVTIGARRDGASEAPTIEDGVYIGAGARVLGNIRVGRDAVIGANAVVTRDVPPGATVVGANRIVRAHAGEHRQ